MLYPIKVTDIELSRPIQTIKGLEGYMGLQGLVRLHGVPIGYVKAPITNGYCAAQSLSKLILEEHSEKIIQELIKNGLASPQRPEEFTIENFLDVPPPPCTEPLPLVTVAVCTRDRTDDLARCLDAIVQLDYPHLDLLVVDNAPSNDATQQLVQTQYPQVRYVREPRPGLDWARNRANIEAYGEIIAYTDDDVVVDRGWVKALATVFVENPEVMAVTGLVVPYELETEAQVLFEKKGGFGRGFERKWYHIPQAGKMPWWYVAIPGLYGTGANMAYRRCVFNAIGGFDPALDVGTVTNGGGDLEMFYRVLKEGYGLVYEPSMIVHHRHRREYEKLKTQLAYNGSVYSYLICNAIKYPDERLTLLKVGLWWIQVWHIRNLFQSLVGVSLLPRDMVMAELWGSVVALTRYQKACMIAKNIQTTFGLLPLPLSSTQSKVAQPKPKFLQATAVRTIELTQPLQPLNDVSDYAAVRLILMWRGDPLDCVEIEHQCQTISISRLCDVIIDKLDIRLLQPDRALSDEYRRAQAIATLDEYCTPTGSENLTSCRLPVSVSVSVVVATYDRPEDLRNCLHHLFAQKTSRPLEIVVVDNHPISGLTPPVVADFPNTVLVKEPRQGLAYARNAGISASTGDIIVATDDDVSPPPDWIEKLVAPFTRPDVMVVTGNTLPIELDTESQWIFEHYGEGGLGRGFEGFEADKSWFERSWIEPVPAWLLGATANAAFRSTIFSHPDIGMMYEPLGPGMPSGVGEDTYLFYKVLKAGYTIVYEPSAFVRHKHRRNMAALRRQLYNYSKGIVSYQITTLLRDRDQRALKMLLIDLFRWHSWRIRQRLKKQTQHPIPLSLIEIMGHLSGPWSLWKSHQRVKREGRSIPYVPVPTRLNSKVTAQMTEIH